MPRDIAPEARQSLLLQWQRERARTDRLFELVREEAFHDRPTRERHRIAFYVGHFEAFDWNLLGRDVLGLDAFHEDFDRLFAFGIDPVDGKLPADAPSDWPDRPAIDGYKARVRHELDTALDRVSFRDPHLPLLERGFLLNVLIEHRQMHAETLAYMLHQLPLDRKRSPSGGASPHEGEAVARMAHIPAGRATLGTPRSDVEFGWDNEFDREVVDVPGFRIDAHNVTNRQFLDFVREGGYEDRGLWSETGWIWKTAADVRHPPNWRCEGNAWFYRAMFGELPLPDDWPVYVSHAEAAAYARWAGKTLPTEAQFHRAAYGTPEGAEREYPWGAEKPRWRFGNFGFARWDPAPVGAYPEGNSAFGVAELVGNGWEWTSTPFEPFPGFEPFSFYPGYSANFFDGQHYVMKGGSARTSANLLRRTFRNWFQPHYPYVYATFRCVARDA